MTVPFLCFTFESSKCAIYEQWSTLYFVIENACCVCTYTTPGRLVHFRLQFLFSLTYKCLPIPFYFFFLFSGCFEGCACCVCILKPFHCYRKLGTHRFRNAHTHLESVPGVVEIARYFFFFFMCGSAYECVTKFYMFGHTAQYVSL